MNRHAITPTDRSCAVGGITGHGDMRHAATRSGTGDLVQVANEELHAEVVADQLARDWIEVAGMPVQDRWIDTAQARDDQAAVDMSFEWLRQRGDAPAFRMVQHQAFPRLVRFEERA